MSALPVESFIVKRTEFLVVAKEADVVAHARDVAEFFGFNSEFFSSAESLASEAESKTSPLVVFISLLEYADQEQMLGAVRHVHGIYARSQVIVTIRGNESSEDRQQLRLAGVHRFILHHEMQTSSKFYYLCSLLVHGTYLPVPVTDLFPGTAVDFNGFHKLPINQNFLPVIFAGFVFSDKKYRRLESVKQVYVKREELNRYRKYIEAYHDNRGNALKKRCRAMMMSLMGSYTELILLLSLDADHHQETLQAQLDQFADTAVSLGDYLKDCPDTFNVIAQSLEFQFCKHERGPYVLAYALFIAQSCGITSLKEIIMAALLSDLGLLELPPTCYRQLQSRGALMLEPNDMEKYQHHPMSSLNRAMLRELPLSDEIKSILVCTHERADEKGFPNQVPADKLPFESQLIHFCKILDGRVRSA
ncbi:MAG: hypothetical protein H7326_08420, partial [Bdellovibrionaceae bacterium]|nr:hypothetical protein [Pseudobdellovibrionaceae bacterium]